MTAVCLTPRCERERIPAVNGNHHAHCQACETRLLRESFGPVSWQDRAITNTLPPLITGGVALDPVHPDSTLSVGREGNPPRSSVSCAQRVAVLATQPA